MEEIKVIDVILPEPTSTSGGRNKFDFPDGVTLNYLPSYSASDYKLIYNNVEYPITKVINGDTWIFYECEEDGNQYNTFQLQYNKSTHKTSLYIREKYVDIVVGAEFKILCNISNEGKKVTIRFNKDNALCVNYNLETGSITAKLFRNEMENPENKRYISIIRFTNDKIIRVVFDNKTTLISIIELE